MQPTVTVTYYLEIFSSWCHWVEPTWAALKKRYDTSVAFDWKIALMSPGDFPASRAQCDWFYVRSGLAMRSPYKLDSGWFELERAGLYPAPNLVAEAGRELGFTDDRLRLALAQAALREGRKLGDLTVALDVATKATGLDPALLRAKAESPAIAAHVQASTEVFHAHRISQRPAFILESIIGDKAVFSGVVRLEPLVATIDAMLADAAAYASHAAHQSPPPTC